LNQDQRKEKNEKNPKKKKKIFQLLNMQIGSNVVVFSNVIRTIYQPRIISQPRPYFIDSFDLDTYTFLDFAVETGLQRALFRARRLYMKRLFPSVDAGRRSGGKTWADSFFLGKLVAVSRLEPTLCLELRVLESPAQEYRIGWIPQTTGVNLGHASWLVLCKDQLFICDWKSAKEGSS
jgi:hypothetical protein